MTVERKYERDIDILLAEEFSVSPAFATWFLSRSKFSNSFGVVFDVFVSKANNLGESDLIVVYSLNDNRRVALLIEDKVDAPLQPTQAERYRQRADREVAAGSFEDYEVILCAPEVYRQMHPGASDFRFISYEIISASLALLDTSLRGKYRASFVETAALRRSNKWVREPDDATDAFWKAVYKLASQDFPMLEMECRPLTKGAWWVEFCPTNMRTKPKLVCIALKSVVRNSNKCHVDLTFYNTSISKFREPVQALLPDQSMQVEKAYASSVIRIKTPAFQVSDGLNAGLAKARIALSAASRLLEFYYQHRQALDAVALAATPP